jgi:hypothetical protein
MHLRAHLELNSCALYSVFIRVKNVLMKPFQRKMKHAFCDKYTISVMFCGCKDNFKKVSKCTSLWYVCIF